MAQLEAMEAALPPDGPTYVCLHSRDWDALADLATPVDVRQAIAAAYQLGGAQQKLYVDLCHCDAPESCPVCRDEPVACNAVQHEKRNDDHATLPD